MMPRALESIGVAIQSQGEKALANGLSDRPRWLRAQRQDTAGPESQCNARRLYSVHAR